VFQTARENFIRSQAAYSLVSYILQVKDRHNGNILIDKEQGYLVHIDFGFILETSPANNLRFERAAFKLTDEMIRIMGGSTDAEPFQLYLTLVIKGFLLARNYHRHIESIVKLMARSGLPCFLPKALENLHSRFFLHLSEI
jgi:phosphatidylinositol 4-kinase A